MTPNPLTSSQVAAALGVTPGRVRQLARENRLRVAGHAGVARLFDRKDVDSFARSRDAAKAGGGR